MTCIVGLVENGTVYMGGDSAAVDRSFINIVKDPKVFINGQYLIGYTSSFRMGQILQFAEFPEIDNPCYETMVKCFIPSVLEHLEKDGWGKKENGRVEIGTFLVGTKGRLFLIDSDALVLEPLDGFISCGSGSTAAQAALFALKDSSMTANDKLIVALESAEYLITSVRRPFHVLAL